MNLQINLCKFTKPISSTVTNLQLIALNIDPDTLFEYDQSFCEHINPKFIFNVPDYLELNFILIQQNILSQYNYNIFQTMDTIQLFLNHTNTSIDVYSTRPIIDFNHSFDSIDDLNTFNQNNKDFFATLSNWKEFPYFYPPTSKSFYIVEDIFDDVITVESEFINYFQNGEYCFDLNTILSSSSYTMLSSEYQHHIINKFIPGETAVRCVW